MAEGRRTCVAHAVLWATLFFQHQDIYFRAHLRCQGHSHREKKLIHLPGSLGKFFSVYPTPTPHLSPKNIVM